MTRPCTCENVILGEPWDCPPGTICRRCRVCWLWHHSPAYRKRWGGNPDEVVPVGGAVVESAVTVPGLGDMVEKALTAVGITKERITKWLGGCGGCADRQEKLNKLGRWAQRVLTRKSKNKG